jgi:transposase-like protein
LRDDAGRRWHADDGSLAMEIDGTAYLTMTEVARQAGVSRQTIWRWRRERRIPRGRLFRDRMVLYATDEAQVIREFANRLEPVDSRDDRQANLFEKAPLGKR